MIHGDQLLALLFTRHFFGMVSVGHKKQGTRPSDGKWVNGEQKTRQKKARAERVLTHTLLLQRRNVKRGCRAEAALSGLHQYDDTQRYTTMHTHTQTRTASRLSSVTHFELYRTFVVRVLFSPRNTTRLATRTTNKIRATTEGSSKMHALKISRSTRCWLTRLGTIACVEHTLTTWRNAASRVDELTLKSQVGGRRR